MPIPEDHSQTGRGSPHKPAAKRTYGYYAIPLLTERGFVTRADMKIEANTLRLLSVHDEDGAQVAREDLEAALERLVRLADLPSTSHSGLRESR
ncbi:hypothetical protein [Streptomyces sp. NPDC047046]|uniref:hypothetical protein n=1 Tax=Streptomyces sp. NPDC047046 TaxID=3155378 RepID=UPI0033C23F01